jgi:type IV pilus biogenesis protein CpaD/CtpE
MKKLQFLVVIILISLGLSQCARADSAPSHIKPEVSIERMNHNITIRGSEVIRYFDKPVLSGDSEAIAKINEYFNNDYKDWLNGNASKFSEIPRGQNGQIFGAC